MQTDIYGRQLIDEIDLCNIFLSNPEIKLKNILVKSDIHFDDELELSNKPILKKYTELKLNSEEFDKQMQSDWFMPAEYLELDVAKYVLDMCKTEEELQRVGDELMKFQDREMFPLLRYCKYLVDTMRKHNIAWGVGRGSSVASYVLFLIGIHRINSLHYDIKIDEFLK